MALVYIFAFFLFYHLPIINSAEEKSNSKHFCPESFKCKDLGELTFPFYNNSMDSSCGFCKLTCNETVPKLQLGGEGQFYEFKRFVKPRGIVIHDQEFQHLLDKQECDSLRNLSIPSSSSISFRILDNITLFKCSKTSELTLQNNLFRDYYISKECKDHNVYYRYPNDNPPIPEDLPQNCSVIQLPLSPPSSNKTSTNASQLFKLLTAEFTLKYRISDECKNCQSREGRCLNVDNKFHCGKAKGSPKKFVKAAAIVSSVAGAILTVVLLCCFWSKCSSCKSMILQTERRKDEKNVEALLKKYGPLASKRYRFIDVKKMTNSFKHKLGQGGYGGVYKGKLQNGPLVAVKILNKLKSDGEEFVNEVASISRTSHINVVTLLGFCYEGSKRALIYEFMPNGSLEKFIYNERSSSEHQLGWQRLYQISLGIARGLEYLHRGCNTRILHFDIKPHNILLDEEFCPKISDFGLAKLCSGKDSAISMLGMRGTPGYIAPEVFSRNFGVVSHKSDVYSYGMMILEMVGGKKNINGGVDRSSAEYFPEMMYNGLEQNVEIGVDSISSEVENETTRKMIIVGLWCIQTDPSNRPSMKRVLEMLEGSQEFLQIPPRPFLVSAPETLEVSSTT